MIEIRLKLKPVGLATVGGGAPTVFGPDLPFATKGDRHYIPGSTFKGVLRSAASRIAKAYGYQACGEINPERLGDNCDVCQLFGSPNSFPRLFVSDFEPTGKVKLAKITRIRIEDETGRAEEGGLYSQEHVWGVEFGGRLRIAGELESNPRLLSLLLLALAELRTGRIGRRTILDLKLEEDGALKLNGPIKEVAEELKRYLWEGRL